MVRNLIHQLKYNNQQAVGTFLGTWLAKELLETKRCPVLDYIVPVPLHQNKLKSRGYNQVAKFGEVLAKELQIPYNDSILLRELDTHTQTAKSRVDRFENLKEKFYVANTTTFKNKHILLIDDVITTGATVEACVIKLQQCEGITVSIATMAYSA